MKLGATRTVIFTEPPAEGTNVADDYRFTLGACSTSGSGQYFACMRDFQAWFEERYGQTNDDARKSSDELLKAEAIRLWSTANDYGAIMASLRKIESRQRPIDVEAGEVQAWQEIPIPAEWNSFETFLDEVPWSLMLALADAAHASNPGVWRFQDGEAAKKNGGVNAN